MKLAILTSPRSGSSSLYHLIESHLYFLQEKYTCIYEPFNREWRNKVGLKKYDLDFFEDKKNIFIKTFVSEAAIPESLTNNSASYWSWFFNYFDKVILLDRKNKDLQSESLTYLRNKDNNRKSWQDKQYYDLTKITKKQLEYVKEELLEESKIIHSHIDKGYPIFYFEDIFVKKDKTKILEMFEYIDIELNEKLYNLFVTSDSRKVRITDEEINIKKLL